MNKKDNIFTEKEKKALEFLINKRDEAYGLMQFEDGELYQLAEEEFNNYLTIEEIIDKQQKEINKLNNENKKIKYFSNNLFIDDYISKEAIREKIKELSEEDRTYTDELSEPDSNFKIIDKNLKRIKNQTDILKELLGE